MSDLPQMRGATSARAYYDPARAKLYAAYTGWTTVIRKGDDCFYVDHRTEAAAHAYLGLDGGSPDPEYRPLDGDTGLAEVLFEETTA